MLAQVDAGADNGIVGVSENAFCLKSSDAQRFSGGTDLVFEQLSIDDPMLYISCGGDGCWGVTKSNTVQFTQTLTTSNCADSGWEMVPEGPELTMIEVSENGRVFGLGPAGYIFERVPVEMISGKTPEFTSVAHFRTGISTRNPKGDKRAHISTRMEANHFNLNYLWVVTKSGFVLTCTE